MTAFDGPVVPDVRMMRLGSQGSTGRDGSARSDACRTSMPCQGQFANRCRHVPDDDHVLQLRGLDLLQSRQQAGMRHHHPRIGQFDGMLQQSTTIARVDRHVHGAEVVRGQPRQDGLGCIRHPAQHVRALLHAERAQSRRGTLHAVERLGERPGAAVLELQEVLFGPLRRPAPQQVADDARAAVRNP